MEQKPLDTEETDEDDLDTEETDEDDLDAEETDEDEDEPCEYCGSYGHNMYNGCVLYLSLAQGHPGYL